MDVGSYSKGEGTRSVLRESWTQPDCEPQHSQNAIDMRHKLRYERGGASHASCRHRNLVKLKCVSLNVSGLQMLVSLYDFAKWQRRGQRTAKHKFFAYRNTTYTQIRKMSTYALLSSIKRIHCNNRVCLPRQSGGWSTQGRMHGVMLNEQDTRLKQTY